MLKLPFCIVDGGNYIMIKKIILLVLIGALAISVLPVYADIFSDISDSEYKEEIEQLKKHKWVY